MAKAQREPVKDTLAEKDEFHPNLRVAATAADEKAKAFAERLREDERRRNEQRDAE